MVAGLIWDWTKQERPESRKRQPLESPNYSENEAVRTPSQVGPETEERQVLAKSVSRIERAISALSKSEDVEAPPTSYAVFMTQQFVLPAYFAREIGTARNLPTPVLGADEAGGILVSWSLAGKYVAAHFGATPGSHSFLYSEDPTGPQGLALSQPNLRQRLEWLVAQ